ncbi:MAG TPA: hypothetical protein VMB03_12195 [Bryobacteraceae bacterium]|nr:hypothetical protein [Bryobacteraceae bacterium]
MSPETVKNTFSTNHVQSLEAAVNAVRKGLENYKEINLAKKINARGMELLKELETLKQSAGKLPLDGPEFTKTKTEVAQYQKEGNTAINDLSHAITEDDVKALEAMVKQVTDAIDKAKAGDSEAGKKIVGQVDVLKRRIGNARLQIGNIPPIHKDYAEVRAAAGQLINETKIALAELAKAPKEVFKFGGSPVADQAELINKIKAHLPQNGHSNINQALNDAVLGRGKATGSVGCLHASAGKIGKNAGGCTLFFKRSGNEIDVIGIGQHQDAGKNQTTYTIHYGLSGKKSVTL